MAVMKCIYWISMIFLLATISDVVMYGTSEGDKCVSRKIEGVCTLVSECELALAALKRTGTHRMKRCGFTSGADAEEIVCCPKTSIMTKGVEEETTTQDTDTRGSVKRKCEQYCEDISKNSMKNVIFHIIGGRDAEQDEFLHMAALGWKTDDGYDFNCGGTIIDSKFCLTAAHCFMRKEKPAIIRVGATRLDDPNAVDYKIKNIIVHNGYSPTNKHNDIALIETEKKITFNEHTYPACLYTGADDPLGTIITGWGKTSIASEDDRSNVLQKAFVEIVDLAGCNKTYFTRTMGTKDIDETQVCAGTPLLSLVQTDACWGDSGGPMQIQNKMGTHSVVGVTSYGQQCGSRAPGVYTRVCKYVEWIEKHVGFTK